MFEWNTINSRIFEIPSYIFFSGIGIVFALSLYPFLLYKKHEPIEIFFPRLLTCSLFLLIGAKTAGIIVSILNTLQKSMNITAETFLETGIVFYGGVLGLIFSFYLICLVKDGHPPGSAFDALAVIIPLFHSLARIGCFCAGCCYGIQSISPVSVYYTIDENDIINSSYRIPVQLIESAFNLIIFIILMGLFFADFKKKNGKLMSVYLFLYAAGRFFLEFLRGDSMRGVYYGVSYSQIISIIIIGFILVKYNPMHLKPLKRFKR